MPGTNLTRDEAATRAALLDVTSYTVDLDLTSATQPEATTFVSTTTLEFTCREPGAEHLRRPGRARPSARSPSTGAASTPPRRTPTAASRSTASRQTNTLVVTADCAYSNTGEGLHRFVDPADDQVYLYSQFEVPDARRVFTTFEQPDLKAVFTFNVTAPSHWVVVSNAATPEPEAAQDGQSGASTWRFPTTKRMSTYITAIVAGEYHGEFDTYEGKFGTIPLGHYCRQSLKEHMDTAELVKLTKQSFEWFEEQFDYPYPFGKYDQLYVPEYNAGRDGERRLRDAARRVPPPQPPAALVLRVPRLGHHPRDGPHVVRRPRHHEVVGRPLAQRVVRRVGLLLVRGQRHRVRRRVDRLRQRPQADRLPRRPAALDAPDRGRQRRPARGRGQLRHDHLRQGRLGAQAARRVGRHRPLPGGPAQLLQGLGVRQPGVQATCSPPWRSRRAASCRAGPRSGCRPRASTRSPRPSSSTPTAPTRRSR